MKRLVALYRSPTYSPAQHRSNDTAILDDTITALEQRGWQVTRSGEADVAAGRLPAADLYVNMCQGPAASERLLDVVPAKEAGVTDAIATFARRGVARVALQAHVGGPIVKFYAIADGRFFSWYAADPGRVDISEEKLKKLVFAAARAVGLEVFGGDVAFPEPDAPVLIDLNDWPSFAPVRAAAAIAAYIDEKAAIGRQA